MVNKPSNFPGLKAQRVYSISDLINGGVFQPFPADEPPPTPPIPRDVLSARLQDLRSRASPGDCQKLRPLEYSPTGGGRHWGHIFVDIRRVVWADDNRHWDMYNKHEKFLCLGEWSGEERDRKGENSRMEWEVDQLIGKSPTCVGCILTDASGVQNLDLTQLLRSEIICIIRLYQRHVKKRPGLARMTVFNFPFFLPLLPHFSPFFFSFSPSRSLTIKPELSSLLFSQSHATLCVLYRQSSPKTKGSARGLLTPLRLVRCGSGRYPNSAETLPRRRTTG